jgi:c-di-GMP-binding flagellar brake protein YcgR
MDLSIGGIMTFKRDEDQSQLEGVLVGTEAPNFIIVRFNKIPDGFSFSEGQAYAATYVSSGIVYRVHNTVLGSLKKMNLVVLTYPVVYDQDVLRKEPRVACSIPATAKIERNALKGLITDISNHGCQFMVKIPSSIKLYSISVLTDINLSLSMLGERDPTRLKGKVRNTNFDEFKIALGIEFEKMESQISQRLTHFIENLKVVQ